VVLQPYIFKVFEFIADTKAAILVGNVSDAIVRAIFVHRIRIREFHLPCFVAFGHPY
jgi:hypothetical protein